MWLQYALAVLALLGGLGFLVFAIIADRLSRRRSQRVDTVVLRIEMRTAYQITHPDPESLLKESTS